MLLERLNEAQRKLFFDDLRTTLYKNGYTADGVSHLDSILDACVGLVVSEAAYVLATAYHECGPALTLKRENMNYSAKRIREVWPSRPEAVKYAGNPQGLANSVYANRMGNGPFSSGDGWRFRGGGFPQVTGRAMYEKFGIAKTPEKLADAEFAARVMVKGMTFGLFTGNMLANYHVLSDPAARGIINADAKRVEGGVTIGTKVMRYAQQFNRALERAMRVQGKPVPVVPLPAPIPVLPAHPAPESKPSLWASLVNFLKGKA